MKVLALETSGLSGEVALLEGDKVIFESPLNPDQRTAKFLAAHIANSLEKVNWKPSDIGLVAVTHGPGSFTGLRVGVTTAKVFAYSTGAKLVAVNSLQVAAAQVQVGNPTVVAAAIDAHRQEVFTANYQVAEGIPPRLLNEPQPVLIEDWVTDLLSESPTPIVTGPVLEKLTSQLPEELTVSDKSCWTLRAATVGQLGAGLYAAGESHDIWALAPEYYRKSAAEEKATD